MSDVNKHTPGPWETLALFSDQMGTDFTSVKIGNRIHMIGYSDEAKANARLIAAAPELLRAVQYAADVFDEYVALHKAKGPEGEEKALNNERHLQRMLDAIAKSWGES